jgi:RNA polymerase sigma-70 factor, ECF subfamily
VEGAVRVGMVAVPAGEPAEFVGLIQPELLASYRLAGCLLGNEAEAEDAICEAIARAWQSRGALRDPDRFAAWFGRIVANVCRDRLRRRRGVRLVSLEAAEAFGSGARDCFRDALARDEVGRLLRDLPHEQQLVLALRFWRDLPLDEIAERLDVPLGTVKSRLHNGLKTLRRELDRQEKVSQ